MKKLIACILFLGAPVAGWSQTATQSFTQSGLAAPQTFTVTISIVNISGSTFKVRWQMTEPVPNSYVFPYYNAGHSCEIWNAAKTAKVGNGPSQGDLWATEHASDVTLTNPFNMASTGLPAGTYNLKQYIPYGSPAAMYVSFTWNGTTVTVVPDKKKVTLTATFKSSLGKDFVDGFGEQIWALYRDGDYTTSTAAKKVGPGQTATWEFYMDALDATLWTVAPINLKLTKQTYGYVLLNDLGDGYWQVTGVADTSSGNVVNPTYQDIISASGTTYAAAPNSTTTATNTVAPISTTPVSGPIATTNVTGDNGTANAVQSAIQQSTTAITTQMAANDSKILASQQQGFASVVAAINSNGSGSGTGGNNDTTQPGVGDEPATVGIPTPDSGQPTVDKLELLKGKLPHPPTLIMPGKTSTWSVTFHLPYISTPFTYGFDLAVWDTPINTFRTIIKGGMAIMFFFMILSKIRSAWAGS